LVNAVDDHGDYRTGSHVSFQARVELFLDVFGVMLSAEFCGHSPHGQVDNLRLEARNAEANKLMLEGVRLD
jgi:hypothetical protein